MAWLKYLKENESISPSSVNSNYSYATCKRFMNTFTPRDTLPQGSWLFVNIENLNINTYQDASIEQSTDDLSYIVVYETTDEFVPVKSVINGNYLYFQTAEIHEETEEIASRYAVYYCSKNLRKLNPIDNGGELDYQISSITNPYYAEYNEVSTNTFEVDLDSDLSYNFSFINSFDDWKNGTTNKPGAKVYISFSGPSIILKGGRGPQNGKLNLRIISLADQNNPKASVAVDWTTIDTFASVAESNYTLYSFDELEERDYIAEIEVLHDKNTSSSGNAISISSYLFKYNVYLTLGKELINQIDNTFTSLGGIR